MSLIEKTFDRNRTVLPTINEVKQEVNLEGEGFNQIFDSIEWFKIREEYRFTSYVLMTDEFLKSVKRMVDDMNFSNIVELSGGTGWFTVWLRKYGVKVKECIDTKEWPMFEGKYLNDIVTEYNSIDYVQEHPDTELFILSWPYMDDVAYHIWEAMNQGQYLLYIGEDSCGCNASENFFRAVEGHCIEDKWDMFYNFRPFFGLHDRPILYRK